MGAVADTSLRALALETSRLRRPHWLQRLLFFRKAKGIHGVHSPLAYRLATEVFMKPDAAPIAVRLQAHLPQMYFQRVDGCRLPEALAELAEKESWALWVAPIAPDDRAGWLVACGDGRVTLAIDCFDSGLLLRSPDVKEKQYLRQRRRK